MDNPVLLGLLLLGGYYAFWYLVKKLLSSTGWAQLVISFRAFHEPAGQVVWVSKLRVGFTRYSGTLSVKATVSPKGLGLQLQRMTFLLAWVAASPPLLIPWVAIGPLVATGHRWRKPCYEASVRTNEGQVVRLRFRQKQLFEAMQLYLPTAR